jgi:ribonuclease R
MSAMNRKDTLAKLRSHIQQLLLAHPQPSLTFKQLLVELQLHEKESALLAGELERMRSEGVLIKTARERFGLPRRLGCLAGTLQGNRRGFAFLRPDCEAEDVFISPGKMKDAAHGDRVMVRLDDKAGGRRREGEVIGILKRGHTRLVGTLERHGKRFFVVPDDERLTHAVTVSRRDLKETRRGDKVVVEIRSWRRGSEPPRGELVERLGPAGSPRVEQLTLHYKYDLPGEFPPPVLKELEALPREEAIAGIASEEGRTDLRELRMVTIDDEQARDFDDAVSLEPAGEGGWRLGVHIADVSHYVRERKALDREALKRATSIYLPGEVIPMLPPLLSEELCSLRAGRDRLAVSVLIELSADGAVAGYRFFPSLIRVAERLTYRQVEAHLKGTGNEKPIPGAALGAMLARMDRLAALLRQKRLQRGALDLDLPEARIILDRAGNPTAVERREMGRAESLIEEFMILCNEVVAEHFAKEKLPLLYRVHAVATAEKLAALRETLAVMGVAAALDFKEIKPRQLKVLLERTRGEPAERLVRYLVLRALPQARYSASNEGHFGLASRFYGHFTSPIRRYPDLVVHRILKEYLARGGLEEGRLASLQVRLPVIAQHASERERVAMEAERAGEDLKKAQYMAGKLGEVYPGIISGVTNFGIFVELDNTVEGMIPLGDLDDDYYVYHEKQAALVGERTRRKYRLGDPLPVRVVKVNTGDGRITFNLA